MNAQEAGKGGDELRRAEKRNFAGACIFAAVVVLVLAAVTTYVGWNNKEVMRISAAGAPAVEVGRLKVKAVAMMNLGSFGLFIAFLGFAVCFARWLSAIRRRRRGGGGLPPVAPP